MIERSGLTEAKIKCWEDGAQRKETAKRKSTAARKRQKRKLGAEEREKVKAERELDSACGTKAEERENTA
jgi:hypothetical protein